MSRHGYNLSRYLLVFVCCFLAACVTAQNTILPTKYKRASLVDAYKTCVATSTNIRYNPRTKPEDIVRQSMASCYRFRNRMVSDYPQRWRDNYAKKIDAELYQREISWVIETRQKER